jgi:hypothetical protein
MKSFRVVPTAEAEEGMCLYEDVRDRAGNVLLPRLSVLSGPTIRSLQRRDIEAVLVVDDSITPEQVAAERVRIQERLVHLWRHAGDGRANALLRTAVEQYRMAEFP